MADCNVTLALFNRPTFLGLLFTELIVGLFGSLGNVILLVGLLKIHLFHTNLRILLFHMGLVALCFSVSKTGKMIYLLIKWKTNPCHLVISLFDCKLKELVAILPLLAMMYSLISVGIERLYATYNYTTYERSRNYSLSIVLIGLTWIFPLFTQLKPLWAVSTVHTTPFCVNLLVMTKTTALWMLILATIQEVTALALFSATYAINRRLYAKLLIGNHLDQTLSARFQLAQNIQVSELMLSTAAAHATFILPTITLAVLVVSGLEIDFLLRVELVHAAYLFALLHALVHPIICFYRNITLRRAFLNVIPRWKKSTDHRSPRLSSQRQYTDEYQFSGLASESDKHFQILLRTWQSPSKK